MSSSHFGGFSGSFPADSGSESEGEGENDGPNRPDDVPPPLISSDQAFGVPSLGKRLAKPNSKFIQDDENVFARVKKSQGNKRPKNAGNVKIG